MFLLNLLLLFLITGIFYMIGPVIMVRTHGKVNSRKAFSFAFLNWLVIHIIFLIIYNLIYPDDINATTSVGPAIWLYIAWKYMTINESAKSKSIKRYSQSNVGELAAKSQNGLNKNRKPISKSYTKNSISDLETKFKLNFQDFSQETHERGKLKFAMFLFKCKVKNMNVGKIITIGVVRLETNHYRYFTVEAISENSFILCERHFDDYNKQTLHINYGIADFLVLNSSRNSYKINSELLINKINNIITSYEKDNI